MVEYAPSTGGLALWVHHQDVPGDQSGLPLSTDGATVSYGPEFEALPVAAQAGLVAHEVLHVALRHAQRYLELQRLVGDVDLQLFTLCADAIVNSALGHLAWLELPPRSVSLDQLLAKALGVEQTVEAALLEWDVERLYRAIDDRKPSEKRAGGGSGASPTRAPKEGGGRGAPREDGPRAARARALGAKVHLDLRPGAELEAAPESEAEQAREWSERVVRGHAGDGAHSMLRALLADVPRTRTPWEQALRTLLAHALSPTPGVSWSRPSRSYLANQGRAGPHRRRPWEPGMSASRVVPRLVVVVDTSGSIDDALLRRFAREVEAIARRQEAALVLVLGDDRVQRVEQFEPGRADLATIQLTGGGGTDFTPLLEEADRHRPDIAVVLTDLDGPARFRPRWPVVWAVPESSRAVVQPFGRKLILS
jgi:predicted metal-dependent peptidase